MAGRLVELPPPTTRLPREKPLPVPKPPTRWEAYAKEKGIVKRKRSAKVWDEEAGEWLGRHGYRRAGDAEGVPILDAKPGDAEGMEDPFSTARAEKRARVSAQEGRQVANLSAAAKRGGARALPAGVTLSSLVPLSGKGGGAPLGSRLGRDGLKQAASLARQATASMGACPRRLSAFSSHSGARRAVQPTARRRRCQGAPHLHGRTTPRQRRRAPGGGCRRLCPPPAPSLADSFALGMCRWCSDPEGQTLHLTACSPSRQVRPPCRGREARAPGWQAPQLPAGGGCGGRPLRRAQRHGCCAGRFGAARGGQHGAVGRGEGD